MKQQDLIIVVVIVFIAGIFSFIISNKFITPSNQKQTAEIVSAIDPNFQLPDAEVFDSDAVNPTVKIQIKPGTNKSPFAEENQ